QRVDIERQVGRSGADDRTGLVDHRRDAHAGELLGVDHGHSGLVGEFRVDLAAAADADLDGFLRVEHAVEHGLAERTAVVETRAFQRAAGIAVGIDVDHSDRAFAPDRPQDRMRYGVVAADGQWNHAGVYDLVEEGFD